MVYGLDILHFQMPQLLWRTADGNLRTDSDFSQCLVFHAADSVGRFSVCVVSGHLPSG